MSTTIDDIIKATGSSKGGFYNHFKNKEDLFHQVLNEAKRIWRKRNLVGLDHHQHSLTKFRNFLENFRDLYLKDSENFPGGCIFITLLVELKEQKPHLAQEINKGFIGLKNLLHQYLEIAQKEGSLKNDTDTKAMTEMIFNGVLGATITYNADRSETNLNETIGYIIDYLESAKAQ